MPHPQNMTISASQRNLNFAYGVMILISNIFPPFEIIFIFYKGNMCFSSHISLNMYWTFYFSLL